MLLPCLCPVESGMAGDMVQVDLSVLLSCGWVLDKAVDDREMLSFARMLAIEKELIASQQAKLQLEELRHSFIVYLPSFVYHPLHSNPVQPHSDWPLNSSDNPLTD